MRTNLFYTKMGGGTPLILLHGFPFNHKIWMGIASAISRFSNLIMPDLRGFGDSILEGRVCSMNSMADDIAALMDTLRLEKAAICGHSMGGYIALAFARCHPDRISGLGLIASQALPDSAEKKASRHEGAEAVLSSGIKSVIDSMLPILTASHEWDVEIEQVMQQANKTGISAAMHAMADRDDATTLIGTVKLPVLILHGRADSLIPIARAREMAELFPQSTLIELPEVGHMPMYEAPSETTTALEHWIQTIEG